MSFYSKEQPGMQQERPFDAATVILVRETEGECFELFLMKRHGGNSFMAGAYVFPGGMLEHADLDSQLQEDILDFEGSAAELLQEPDLGEPRARALFLCAARELFEETGVLLAVVNGLPAMGNLPQLFSQRLPLQKGERQFSEFARSENLSFLPGRLIPYSRWITPVVEPKRFDTRFFLARLPQGQTAEHDGVELVDSLWVTPAQALKRHDQGELSLMPPTLKTIEELSEFDTLESLLDQARRERIFPIMPEAFVQERGVGVRLPYDPQYANEEYRQPPRRSGSTRILLIDGKWRTAGPEGD